MSIDAAIVSWLNGFVGRSHYFDVFVWLIGNNALLKAGPFLLLTAWQCFRVDGDAQARRMDLLAGMVASWAAVFAARALSFALPFRVRPLANPELHFVSPIPGGGGPLEWSSFPSDNAALFFGLAAALFVVSRGAGVLAFLQALLVIGLARVYFGWHYPSDILGGAVLGIACVALAQIPQLKSALTRPALAWLRAHPPSFGAVLGILLFLNFMTFEPLYPLLHGGIEITEKVLMREP